MPRWSDAIYHLEQDPHALVTILDGTLDSTRWLQYRGVVHIDASSTNDRYGSIHFMPERIDLIDDNCGYGSRETLDL